MPDQPNVVLLLADQWRGDAWGEGFHTPNLDALAERSVRFTGAHCTLPQCSPARSSLVTGQYPHQTGVRTLSNWGPFELDPDAPSVGRAFREAGYRTGWAGRWDLGDGNWEPLGWRDVGVDVTGTAGRDGGDVDAETAASVASFVEDGDQPFFAVASLNLPHPPYVEYEAFGAQYDRDAVPLPDSVDDDLADAPAHVRERAADLDLDVAEIRDLRYCYRTMVSETDRLFGTVLDALDRAGVRDDTIVAVTADHGDMTGAHGLSNKGTFAYDEILRVPLLLDVPDLDPARQAVPDLVSTRRLPATLLDAAGVDPPADLGGESLLPATRRSAAPDDDRVFFEHAYAWWGHHPLRGVRTRRYKYVEYPAVGDGDAAAESGPGTDRTVELYDCQTDPGEQHNLADDPDHAAVRDRLRAAVEDWWDRTGGDLETWTTPPGE